MKLHEIIDANDSGKYVSFESYTKYIHSLYVYYNNYFVGEPAALIINVTNAGGVMKIVDSNYFHEEVLTELNVDYVAMSKDEEEFDEDLFAQYENICANSMFLIDLLAETERGQS